MYAFAQSQFAEPAARPLELAVIVPTLNEAANVGPLLDRLAVALGEIAWEVIFVDDGSIDDTVPILSALALREPRVRLIRRYGRRGLASAVVEGMLSTPAPVLAVIDADLQHDERILPQLYRTIVDQDADVAVGTRYAAGGSTGDWQAKRLWISRCATRVADTVLDINVSDPMSGFFAVRREAFLASLPRLSNFGYKILLDILASAPEPLSIREVPYRFALRTAGESKLDATIAFEYGLLLLDKTVGRWIPIRLLMFICVGALGLIVNLAMLGFLAATTNLRFVAAQSIAVVGAMTFNFLLNNVFTYRDRRRRGLGLLRGLLGFYLACGLGGAANVSIGGLALDCGASWWIAGSLGAGVGCLWNYVASSILAWRR
jgi:dolichol-phosphate mannosyltransferase